VANSGLPWVGRGPGEPNPRDNFAPPPGIHDQKAVAVQGDATHENGPIHESLRGEVHPDKPGTARPG
jgi:hypothetical protein